MPRPRVQDPDRGWMPPTAILLRRNRLGSKTALKQLRTDVKAVLDVGPPQTTP